MSHKVKTRKSIKNRFKMTKNGKILHKQSFASHLKSSKSKSQLRRLKREKRIKGKIAKKIIKLLNRR